MVDYEWCIEEYDDGNIVDSHFFDECPGIPNPDDYENTPELVLVRESDRDFKGWAYINSEGALPSHFECAHQYPICKVPVRFVAELKRKLSAK